MSYSKAAAAYERVKDFLAQAVELKGTERLSWEGENPQAWSFLIRQAINYCHDNPDVVGERLAGLKGKIVTRVKGTFLIIELKNSTLPPLKPVGTHKNSYPEALSVSDAITIILKSKDVNEFRFPNIVIIGNNDQKVMLDKYTSANGMTWKDGGVGIIITRNK